MYGPNIIPNGLLFVEPASRFGDGEPCAPAAPSRWSRIRSAVRGKDRRWEANTEPCGDSGWSALSSLRMPRQAQRLGR